MAGKIIKAVLDTNILVSGLWTPGGNPAKILSLILLDKVIPCFTFEILKEYTDVLNRPKLKFSGDKTASLLHEIEARGLSIIPEPSAISFVHEDDRVFFDTAKTAGAFLISGNIRHFPKAPFVLSAADFLAQI